MTNCWLAVVRKNIAIALIFAPPLFFCSDIPANMISSFHNAGQYYNVNPSITMALGKIESNYNQYAYNLNTNGTADVGVMQINTVWIPNLTKNGMTDPRKLYEYEFNIFVGTWILKQCINRFGQSWRTIDCYNKGPSKAKEASKYIDRFAKAIPITDLFYSSLVVRPLTSELQQSKMQ